MEKQPETSPVPPDTNTPPQPKTGKPVHHVRHTLKALPEKKQYFELLTAALSVPIMITVLILNLNNLKKPAQPTANVPTPSPTPIVHMENTPTMHNSPKISSNPTPSPVITPDTTQACIKQVGPVNITSPDEGDVVTDDPVCIDITRSGQNYCEVAWAYRINGGAWSSYTNGSICIYGLPAGQKTVEVKVKSIASSDEQILKRTFTVDRPTPTQPVASPSAQPQ